MSGFFDVDPDELEQHYRQLLMIQDPALGNASTEAYRAKIAAELSDLFDEEVEFTANLVSQLCRSSSIQEAAGELSPERWWDLDKLVTALGYGLGAPTTSDETSDFVSMSVTRRPNWNLLRRALKEVDDG